MEKELREYQKKGYDAVFNGLEKGITKQIISLPGGAGKTLLASRIASKFKRILFMSHTEELLSQSGCALLSEFYPELDVNSIINTHGDIIEYFRHLKSNSLFRSNSGEEKMFGIVKADLFEINNPITLCSFQTIHRRLEKIPNDWFDLVIIDECHMSGSRTISGVLNYLKPKLLIGLSATPYRIDGMPLADIFDEIIYDYPMIEAIMDGYLCELDAIQIKTTLNLDNVRTTAGEFNQKDLRETVDTPERNELLYTSYKKYADGLQNVIFCVDVEHAQNVLNLFLEKGESIEILVGDIEITSDRQGVIRRFKNGETMHLVNVIIATTGWDYPGIMCITDAAPTKSKTRALQKWLRGTRTLPGVIDGLYTPQERRAAIKTSKKSKCILLDICDSTTKHRIVNTWSLDRELPIEQRVFTTTEKKEKLLEFRAKQKFDAVTQKDTRIDLLKLPVVKISDSLKMKEDATQKQLDWLKKLGYDVETINYTKEMATQLISFSPASEKQVGLLRFKGYDTSRGVTVGEATLAFNEITKREEKERLTKQLPDSLPMDDLF